MGHPPFTGDSVADFVYQDTNGVLTEQLFGQSRRDLWKGMWPTYYLEVKTTSNSADARFHIKAGQLATVRLSPVDEPWQDADILTRKSV